jgi:serine/threonine protein kinase
MVVSEEPASRYSPPRGGKDGLLETSEPPAIPGLRLDRMIGEGGFGQVWQAQRDDGTPVAVKVLHL